jgi:hypothetical protein
MQLESNQEERNSTDILIPPKVNSNPEQVVSQVLQPLRRSFNKFLFVFVLSCFVPLWFQSLQKVLNMTRKIVLDKINVGIKTLSLRLFFYF